MSSIPFRCDGTTEPVDNTPLIEAVLACGACAAGTARAEAVNSADRATLDEWLQGGHHAGMAYMLDNRQERLDPRLLHPDTRTVIAAAFNYRPAMAQPLVADYAQGIDYHYVVKQRLSRAADDICARFGGSARVVVDSAPMRERYWARRAGIGYTGDNGLLIVPGFGSAVVLGFILWTGNALTSTPRDGECLHCGRCAKACPGRALDGHGGVDGRRCLSYLTIEYRGEFATADNDSALPPAPRLAKVYGCDCCRQACPLDRGPATDLPEFAPTPELLQMSVADFGALTSGTFRRRFAHSPLWRSGLRTIRRNASLIHNL